jgi:hypothetical protein
MTAHAKPLCAGESARARRERLPVVRGGGSRLGKRLFQNRYPPLDDRFVLHTGAEVYPRDSAKLAMHPLPARGTCRAVNMLAASRPSGSTSPMTHTTATSRQLTERAARPRRGGRSRLQAVGDYTGQLAGQAAQAVRRAGLKPGLERSFGFAPELLGQIVAQEPQAGGELARNGLVTLYVAAPGSEAPVEAPVAEPVVSEHSKVEVASQRLALAEPTSVRSLNGPRARKSHRAPGVGGSPIDPPPPPRFPNADRAPEAVTVDALEHVEAEEAWVGEQYVIGADELFGGRVSTAAPAWRRVYPRRHRGLDARLSGRPRLVTAALAILGVWLLVAGAAALTGHRGSARQSSGPHQHWRVSVPAPSLASVPPRPHPSETRATTARDDWRRPHSAPKRARAHQAPVRRAVEQATHVESAPAAHRSNVGAPARREFGAERRKAEGGPFSP